MTLENKIAGNRNSNKHLGITHLQSLLESQYEKNVAVQKTFKLIKLNAKPL